MGTTKLSSKGQVIIPKDVRQRRRWKPGQTFDVIETDAGVLLRPHRAFPAARMEDVAGCLEWDGPPVPVERLNVEALPYRDPYADDRD